MKAGGARCHVSVRQQHRLRACGSRARRGIASDSPSGGSDRCRNRGRLRSGCPAPGAEGAPSFSRADPRSHLSLHAMYGKYRDGDPCFSTKVVALQISARSAAGTACLTLPAAVPLAITVGGGNPTYGSNQGLPQSGRRSAESDRCLTQAHSPVLMWRPRDQSRSKAFRQR